MSEAADAPEQAERRRAPRFRLSPIWLVPLGAALIGCWLLYQSVISRGHEITLSLPTAEGLEAGKTTVKLRNVNVGEVKDVRLSQDYSKAIARIQMEPDMSPLLVEDTQFWVVKPRIGRQGISGLGTIISGAYIQMRPGDSDAHEHDYEVLEQPPVTRAGVPGLSLVLLSDDDRSLSVGDPIVYQGHEVGQIESAKFDVPSRRTRYRAFVQSPYDELITKNTQFWSRSGVDFDITSEGVEVSLGNLQSVLTGGVTFGVLGDMASGQPAANGDQYPLYPSRSAASDERFDKQIKYLALFGDSLRGLYEGASVEFRGVRVGTVVQAPYYGPGLPMQLDDKRLPVLISFEPQRIGGDWSKMPEPQWRERLAEQFDQGLRASLKTSNLLTGALYVGLDFAADSEFEEPRELAGYPVFPSQSSGLSGIEQKVTRLLDKINALEVNPVLAELQATLDETGKLMGTSRSTLTRFNNLLDAPGTQNLPVELNNTLRKLQKTLDGFQQGQPAYQDLQRSLDRLNRILEDVAPLAETLRENPNALIFGQDPKADPEPQAAP